MLVLQRKKGETLLIGEDIRISVLDLGADGVKLAIEAPRKVRVLREELLEAAKANQDAVADKDQIKKLKNIFGK